MIEPGPDHERVRELLGREPLGAYEVVVRDDDGDPVVLRNAPLLDDGTPMPTRYWLVGPAEHRRIGRLEADGGVDAAEAAVDADELAAAHARYAAERDAAIPADHDGPRPSGGVGGTRQGVKCLHAHWAWHLAGGDDPVGRWIDARLAEEDASPSDEGARVVGASVEVGPDRIVIEHEHAAAPTVLPVGASTLTERWLTETDPPRPDALTNALGTIDDHLDDLVRLHPDVARIDDWSFSGPTIASLAAVEAGHELPAGRFGYARSDAEEVFRILATEPSLDRAANPGLPSRHVDVVVAASIIVQTVMRRFHLEQVTLVVAPD